MLLKSQPFAMERVRTLGARNNVSATCKGIMGKQRTVLHARRLHASKTVPKAQQGPGPGPGSGPNPEDRLINALTAIGLTGTIAVGGAALVNLQPTLFEQLRWSSTAEIATTFSISSSLFLLEAALLLPPYYLALQGSLPAQQQQPSTPDDGASQLLDEGRSSTTSTSIASTRPQSSFNLQMKLDVEQAKNPLSFEGLRAVLALHQACFIATQVLARPPGPWYQDAALVTLREAAKEMLQRGLVLTFLSTWLSDRAFEAGADDSYLIAGDIWYTTEICRWAVADLLTTFMIPAVLTQSKLLSMSVATNWAMMSTQSGDEAISDPLIQEYRLMDALEKASDSWPAKLTYSLSASYGLLRFACLNASFAATGNLAASMAVAVLSNLLLLLYTQLGRGQLNLEPKPKPQ